MTGPTYPMDPDTYLADNKKAAEIGGKFAEEYQSGQPYNHICIDNFLDEKLIDQVKADLMVLPEAETSFNRAQERLKTSYVPERLPKGTRDLFYALNSRPFLLFLEQMTGIKGLIPDPYFIGAGIHKTQNGGHLDIHADFNLHGPMQLERRLNVLIYLNDDWKEEWGGCFEIWNNDMTQMVKRFAPLRNRMVCFSTSSTSMHGNPEPVNHPEGEPRQSIALYYYTATWDESRKEHGTIFKPRPGSVDDADRASKRHEFVKDLLPPALHRKIGHRLRRIGL
ncbi:2OG-Fe(II) oxygenase [Paracoccus sp. Z330]|uniref:2OG-Fe(II) oxygenase n=1 Tax=Paracoccus onchidii TaxID=3017813 RepID=A0ABT4ZH04_9RHOB|nr:2OG-Fe(II) oxygenase [Paracoccus onchidii]MDB6178596.1 2OG-Fe(II) oxygenase [Paracoccus onchidii]